MRIINVHFLFLIYLDNLTILNDLSDAATYIISNDAKLIISKAHKCILDRMEHFKK